MRKGNEGNEGNDAGCFLKKAPLHPEKLSKKKQEHSREGFSYLCKGKGMRYSKGAPASGGDPFPIRSTKLDYPTRKPNLLLFPPAARVGFP